MFWTPHAAAPQAPEAKRGICTEDEPAEAGSKDKGTQIFMKIWSG